MAASRATEASTGPKYLWAPYLLGQSLCVPGREGVKAVVIKEQAVQRELGGKGRKGVRCRRGAPSWQCPIPWREGRSPPPGSPNSYSTNDITQATRVHSHSLPCFGAKNPGTHIPQAEVTHWPVVRLLPMPAGAGRVQCPIV